MRTRYHDGDGNVEESGPWSDTAEITVTAEEENGDSTNPPAKPTGLLTGVSQGSVLLLWDDPGDDTITGYQVLRGPNPSSLAVLTSVTGAVASYSDNTVEPQTKYAYAIRARNANGLGPPSDTVSVKTLKAPPEEDNPPIARSIAGVDFTLGGQALDTSGSNCQADLFADIGSGCTINLLTTGATLAIVGTYDSNDRMSVRTGRDKDNLTTVAEGNIEDLDGTSDLDLTFEPGRNLLRLWGDEDGNAGGAKEHFYRVNVLPTWTLDGQTISRHADCRQAEDAANPVTSSAECMTQTADSTPDFQFVNVDAAHFDVYLDVNGNRIIDTPDNAAIGNSVAVSLNTGDNLLRVRLASKSHSQAAETFGNDAFYYKATLVPTATIEAVETPIFEGEKEVRFRITLSAAAPTGGVDVMVELTQETPANPGPIADADFRMHTVNVPQGQTQAVLEVLSSRNEIQSNSNQVNAEILPGTGYTVGANSEASVLVQDRDKVNVGFADGCGQTITVGEAEGQVSFDIVLNNPVSYRFTLVIDTLNGKAKDKNDYEGPITILQFEKQQTRVTAMYKIIDDAQLEDTEDFTIVIYRSGLDQDILTPTCGETQPHLRIEIIDDDIPTIVLDAPAEVTEGQPISIGLGPRPNVGCPVQFPFTTTLTISDDTDELQGNPATSVPLRLAPCGDPQNIKILNDDNTESDPIYQTIDRPGIQGDRSVTFTISPLMSDYSTLVNQLTPDRMSATVIIKDKPNNEASGSLIITGEPMVGQTLTADTSGISDQDGLNNAVFTYRWYGTYALKTKDLSAQSTYTVQESDIRRQIKLVVSFTDDVGYKERISATTDAVVPDVRYYFLRTEKSIEEPQSGQREVGTWVYLNDWPRVRSADGTRVHFWGVEPVVPFNIPYTVSYEDGARASWFEVAAVTFSATTDTNGFTLQGRSKLIVTIKQISKKVDRREVPAGQELGKIVITLGDHLDLPNGPRLNFRDEDHKLTMTIISNGKP